MKFVLSFMVVFVSAALAVPLTPDTKPVEKSGVQAPDSGLVKPVALATGVPSVKVTGPAGPSNTEEKTSSLAKDLDKVKSPSSPAAVGHSADKPAAVAPVSAPVRSNSDKPAPATHNAPPRVSHKPASNSYANTPVHKNPSPSLAQKDAPHPVNVQAPQKDAASTSNVNNNNNRQPLVAH